MFVQVCAWGYIRYMRTVACMWRLGELPRVGSFSHYLSRNICLNDWFCHCLHMLGSLVPGLPAFLLPVLASHLATGFLDTGVLCHIWIFTWIQANEHSKQAWVASAFKLWGISLPTWHNIFLQIINKVLWN